MTDRKLKSDIEKARELLVRSKRWGTTCKKAILGGFWDNGQLIKSALAKVHADAVRTQQEEIGE